MFTINKLTETFCQIKTYAVSFLVMTFVLFSCISCDKGKEKIEKKKVIHIAAKDSVSTSKLNIGYGWSTLDKEEEAVNESIKRMTKKVSNPNFVVLYTTVGYDVKKISNKLNDKLKGAKVFGVTSSYAVISTDGVHVGKKGSMAIMGFSFNDMRIGVAGAEIKDLKNARERVKDLVKKAIQNAGKTVNDIPKIILIGTTPGFEERSIKGIEDVLGADVPVYGGSAADNTIEGKWAAFAGDKIITSGVSLAIIYSDLKVGQSFACGYLGTKKRGIVTKVDGRKIMTIDNKPAGAMYNTWTNGYFDKEMKSGEMILVKSALYPLAIKVKVGIEKQFVSYHPARIDPKTKSLALFAEVKEGTEIFLLEGKEESLLKRTGPVTRRALVEGRIKKRNVAGALHIYCAGTMMAVKKNIKQIAQPVNSVIGKSPFIGAFTFGEQGAMPGKGNFHGNLMNSMVVFGKK